MIFTTENFKQEVEESLGIVLVDFYATWCGPCQIMAPIIEELISENKDANVKIGKLNIDEAQDISTKYNVMSIPTLMLFKDGKTISRISGYRDKQDLLEWINKNKT